jgi:hypothetical protein
MNEIAYQSGEVLLQVLDNTGEGDELLDLNGGLLLVDVGHFNLALGGGGAGLQNLQELFLFFFDGGSFSFTRKKIKIWKENN